jgi:hypothetical protein
VGVLLLGLAVVFALWPRWIGIPVELFGAWLGVSLLLRAYKLYLAGRRETEVVVQDTDMQEAAEVGPKEGKGSA